MRVEASIWTNPKFVRLSRALAALAAPEKLSALEYLVKIWGYCETGQRGEFWDGAGPDHVEAVCDWTGEPGALARVLQTCGIGRGPGFIIVDHRGVTVHQWNAWNSRAVTNWKLGTRKKTAAPPDNLEPRSSLGLAKAEPSSTQDAREGIRVSERVSERVNEVPPQGARGDEEMTDPDPEHVSPRTSPHPEIAIPTDADVAAAADAYPGSPAQAIPPGIPRTWATRWWTNAGRRALQHPDGWRRRMYAEFASAAHLRQPGTNHAAPAAPAAPTRATPPTTKALKITHA